ncbi:unnamed protein product [Cuscuta epithymum]|uniref:Uncharacterized protein n=1 Tax=Cuscuta epithymum TaxID=186058 RepID=A0AAV0CDI0_9ASTE|nr:unnamed protein product [Cuscuta epithymum]
MPCYHCVISQKEGVASHLHHSFDPRHPRGVKELCNSILSQLISSSSPRHPKREFKEGKKGRKGVVIKALVKGDLRTFTKLKELPELSPEFIKVRRSFTGVQPGRVELHNAHSSVKKIWPNEEIYGPVQKQSSSK